MYEMMQFKHKRHTKCFAPFRDRNSVGEILKSFSTKECFGIEGSSSIFPETLNRKTWNKTISFERHIQSRSNQARSDWNLHRILDKCFNFKYQISYMLALFNVIHCAVKVLTAWVTPTFLLLVVPADPFQSQQAKLTLFHLDNHAQS